MSKKFEVPYSKETYEGRAKKLREAIEGDEWAKRRGMPWAGNPELEKGLQRRKDLVREILDDGQEEATKLNDRYDDLITKALKALTDLHDFEISELGMKEGNAIAGNLDEHRGSAEKETQA